MEINGKVYRNLEGQVGYLTDKYDDLQNQIDELRAQIPSKMIVEELPEEGDPLITYYVGPKGTEPNLYYEVWVWVQEEPEGPFVWRELEDTDQVDLSGYLPIQNGVTTYPQAYVKKEDGTQDMLNITTADTANSIPVRNAQGRVKTGTPSADNDSANKKYCDDTFLAKQTGTTSFQQLYAKTPAGDQTMLTVMQQDASPNTIPQRDGYGRLWGEQPSGSQDKHLVNLKYANDHYLAKQTGTTSYPQLYCKKIDGTQEMRNVAYDLLSYGVPLRDSNGGIKVPTTPINNGDAASKAYVDAAVGQLLYLHDIEIIVTVDATNKLYIKAYLINGSATAITSIDIATFKRMDVQYGCFGVDVDTGTPCAVTKKPDSFVYGNFTDPRPSYLYQYISGGTLQAYTTTNSMAVTVTDTVISF